MELLIENTFSNHLGGAPVTDKFRVSFHVFANAHHGIYYQIHAAFSVPGVMLYKITSDLAQRACVQKIRPRKLVPMNLAAPNPSLITAGNIDIPYQVRDLPERQHRLAIQIEKGILEGIKRCRRNPGQQQLKRRWSFVHWADAMMGFIQVEFYKEKTSGVNVNLWSNVRGVKKQRSAKGDSRLLAAVLKKTA